MSKSFADMINCFQRRVHCIVTPCLIYCSAPGQALCGHVLGQLLISGKAYKLPPMYLLVSPWLALFDVRYLHLLDLIVRVQVNCPAQVKLISPALAAVVGHLCSWVILGSQQCPEGFELGTR